MKHLDMILMMMFIIKHFLCDFPLQTPYMLGKSKSGMDWILPLLAHSSTHALFSLGILILFQKTEFFWLAGIELIAHFIIDRIKATHKLKEGVWAPHERGKYLTQYYVAFGLDQTAHYLTYAAMIFVMIQ